MLFVTFRNVSTLNKDWIEFSPTHMMIENRDIPGYAVKAVEIE